MLHKRSAALILAMTLPALAGCIQATRHSNTMVFGTNTSLAVRVGQGANQIPEISVGYARQEAVIMPLLANTQENGEGQNSILSPCGTKIPNDDNTEAVATLPSTPPGSPHPCKFVATKTEGGNVTSQDSYSVLASFGANIKARSPGESTQNTEIGVGIAQYFATGVAAQLLAANGGAAVVAVSAGATESAESTGTGKATAAVTGTKALTASDIPNDLGTNYVEAMDKLLASIRGTTSETDRVRKITYIYNNLDQEPPFAETTLSECAKGVTECERAVNGDGTSLFGSVNLKALVDGWAGY